MNKTITILAICIIASFTACTAFYLPGVAPKEFKMDDQVILKYDKMDSTKTQLPYSVYDLPFCTPKDAEKKDKDGNPDELVVNAADNLGEVLAGDRMESSPYDLRFKKNHNCQILCKKEYSEKQTKKMQKFIENDYKIQFWIDNLPGAQKFYYVLENEKGETVDTSDMKDKNKEGDLLYRYDRGYLIGEKTNNGHAIFNHLRFTISYHDEPGSYEGSRIVGFEFEPFSVKHQYAGAWKGKSTYLTTCNAQHLVSDDMKHQYLEEGNEVIYSYDVKYVQSATKWAQRWNIYFRDANPDNEIHWFSIINSLMIVVFLTGMVAMIMIRTLRRDISKYNEDTADDLAEETGWKLVHGDVFRPPSFSPMLLSIMVGTGHQMLTIAMAIVVFASFGFLSPANRGGLLTASVLLFVFAGVLSGYHSSRMYKLFAGKSWRSNALLSALFFPGISFLLFFVLNLFVWGQESKLAAPFGTIIALASLWGGVYLPLAFCGSYFGFKRDTIEVPCKYNQIPRQIPEQQWYMHPLFSFMFGGILPFGAVFIEIYFIMSAIWMHQIYYVFGFLFVVLGILIVTCAEITVVMCYFQLCCEDYKWWWRTFLASGSAGFYLYLYSFMYFFTKLEITNFTSSILYFGYMWLISFGFFLLTGNIGFQACFWFNKQIFGAVKID